jgi:hypothetical protein
MHWHNPHPSRPPSPRRRAWPQVSLSEALAGSGFDPKRPSVFLAEGLIYYLPPQASPAAPCLGPGRGLGPGLGPAAGRDCSPAARGPRQPRAGIVLRAKCGLPGEG